MQVLGKANRALLKNKDLSGVLNGSCTEPRVRGFNVHVIVLQSFTSKHIMSQGEGTCPGTC